MVVEKTLVVGNENVIYIDPSATLQCADWGWGLAGRLVAVEGPGVLGAISWLLAVGGTWWWGLAGWLDAVKGPALMGVMSWLLPGSGGWWGGWLAGWRQSRGLVFWGLSAGCWLLVVAGGGVGWLAGRSQGAWWSGGYQSN